MEAREKKTKPVCTPFDEETFIRIQKAAGRQQSVASVIRIAVLKYLKELDDTVAVSAITAPAIIHNNKSEQSVQEVKPKVSEVITANYPVSAERKIEPQSIFYGVPVACPVCGKEHGELGIDHPALSIVNSGPDWGAWACYECFSSGRWYNTQPTTILKNTQEEQIRGEEVLVPQVKV